MTEWIDHLAAHGARFASPLHVTDFGQLAAEQQATAKATVVVPLLHLGLIACEGAEATDFLHNQLTSDVRHLAADRAQLSSWCSAKGRMLASFHLWRTETGYWLNPAADLVEATAKRLQMFVLRAKVVLSDQSTNLVQIGLAGPAGEQALTAAGLPCPADTLATAAFDGGRVLRLSAQRWVIVAESAKAIALWPQLASQATPAGRDSWLWHDIQEGLPLVTLATKEAFVPQMVNFEKIGGVSFNKGCYPGQEIVARTQYLGKVKRHMHRGHSTVTLQVGDELFSPAVPDQACGRIAMIVPSPTSGWDVLAVVQENAVTAPIAAGSENGPTFTVAAQPACEAV